MYEDDFPIQVELNKEVTKTIYIELKSGTSIWAEDCQSFTKFKIPKFVDISGNICESIAERVARFSRNHGFFRHHLPRKDFEERRWGRVLERFLEESSEEVTGVQVIIENNNDEDLDVEATFTVDGKFF